MPIIVSENHLERITRIQNVLAVDDVKSNLKLLTTILRSGGFSVSVAFSGEEALKILSRTVVDVALLDIEMPGMSGFQLYEEMLKKNDLKTIPVIFVSADNKSEAVKKAIVMGAVSYVVKPYDAESLTQKVQSALDFAKVDQAALYLDKKLISLLEGAMKQDPATLDSFTQIPVDLFIPKLSLNLNRLKIYLSSGDFDAAVKLIQTLLSDLHKLV